jgi:hypothetical protein
VTETVGSVRGAVGAFALELEMAQSSVEDRERIVQINDFELVGTDIGLDASALPTDGWWPALVPGGVHESLVAAGRIEGPLLGPQRERRAVDRGARLVAPGFVRFGEGTR